MIIITDKVGQLCNRLFQFSYVIANSIENNYRVINLNFDDYSEFFKATINSDFDNFKIRTHLFKRYPRINIFIRKIFNKINSFFLKKNMFKKTIFYEFLNIDNGRYDMAEKKIHSLAKNKLLLLSGDWYFDYQNFIKHSDLIRHFFRPIDLYQKKIEEKIVKIKEKNTLLIGVHIRKGDYIDFMGGQFYFDNQIYAERMKQAEELFKMQQVEIRFLLFSNEIVNLDNFKKFNIYYEPEHFIVDLYSLAQCDYIIGPLSTFSMWASFYGNVPLWQITKLKIHLTIDDFQIKNYC